MRGQLKVPYQSFMLCEQNVDSENLPLFKNYCGPFCAHVQCNVAEILRAA